MKDYKKYFILNAPPDEVYLALTNPFTISLWTNEEAEMSTEPGSDFSMLGGNIEGKNLEFEQDKKIVQQWYFGDEDTPTPSIVTIKLHKHGEEGTSLELKHTNIPDEAYEDMVEGWNEIYLAGLDEFFNE